MFRALTSSASARKVVFLLTLLAVTSCSLATEAGGPAAIIKISGDAQSAPPNTALTTALAIGVFSQFGERVPNITVTWTIVSGGGTLSANSSQTDESGVASVIYTTGATAGPVTIEAHVQGIPPLTFNITVI